MGYGAIVGHLLGLVQLVHLVDSGWLAVLPTANVDHLVMVGIGGLRQLELGFRTAGHQAGDCVGVDVVHLVMVGGNICVLAGGVGCVVVPPSLIRYEQCRYHVDEFIFGSNVEF